MTNTKYYFQYFLTRIFRILLIFLGLLFIISLFLLNWVSREDVTKSQAYQETMKALEVPVSKNEKDSLKIGWAKESITPAKPYALAGYGARKGKVYKTVHDSIFVRSFVFQTGNNLNAIVVADLLIFPPEVIKALKDKLPASLNLSNTFFSATHSHSSIGGWQPGFVGELFAGQYDPKMVSFIASKVVVSLEKALKDREKASLGFRKVNQEKYIRNRLVKERGTKDPWLRTILMEKASGKQAVLFSYSAHATCLSYHYSDLSGDYPAKAISLLEKEENIDFAAYMAGAVGSMAPEAPGLKGYEKVDFMANQLTGVINKTLPVIDMKSTFSIAFNDFSFLPGDPQFKVTEDIKVREWVFYQLFGKNEMEITSMKIGDLLLVGLPCDFSGELVAGLEKHAANRGIELIITSFNGGYAGYVTKDEWYNLSKYETRTMNWYGHETGKYMSDAVTKIIDGYAQNQ